MRRETKVLVVANVASSISWGLCWSYLYYRLTDLGASYFQLCLMDSLAAATYLLSRIWGALSDYYGRRKPFMLSGFAASALPMILMALRNADVWALICSYVASCFAWGIAYPAYMAALTSDPEREKATTLLAFVGSASWALGVSMMGPVEGGLGPGGVFAVCFLVALAFPLALLAYRERPLPRKEEPLGQYLKITITPRFRAERGFGFFLIGAFLSWLGLQWASTARVKLYELLGCSKTKAGVVWAVNSLVSAFTVLLARRLVERLGGIRTLAASIACYAIVVPSYGLVWSPPVFVLLWITPIWPFFNLGCMLSPAELSSEDVRGEAMGAGEVAKNLGVLSGVLGGILADALGREVALLLAAVPFGMALVCVGACYKAHEGRHVTKRRKVF
ncbi:MAG TPA: MFS transporter [Candidatus Bathyarchaeota archaeon]|nr:MFS transporter [Candidatus Bathyarchaeota archaeon]